MRGLRLLLAGAAFSVLIAACGGGVPRAVEQANTATGSALLGERSAPGTRACPRFGPDEFQCDVLIVKTGIAPNLAGWGPSNIQAAYNLPSSSSGSGQIVAIVDAYDNPTVASDLAEYRSHFGLPPANFAKYNQNGQQYNYPGGDTGWGVEIDLDVQMVSAACPNCTIYLIEANDNGKSNLGIAEKEAVTLGATIVSNSWSCNSGNCSWHTKVFDAPGVVYLAAAGDDGYGSNIPAEFANVVSVGGTLLSKKDGKYKEIAWPFTGGGCSSMAKPSWQHDPGCTTRTQNDVAAVASDVAEYDSYGYGGWMTNGGTSVATPLIASVYALAGNARSQHAGKKFWALTTRERRKYLHAITEGSDGNCGGSYLCTAGTGQYRTYSGPTGWGTPNGIGAF